MPTATGTERSAHSNALASALAVARRGLRLRSSNCDAPIAPARRPHRAAGRLRLARPPLYAVEVTQKRGPRHHDRPSGAAGPALSASRSEEHTSELQSLMRISYAVFCLKKKKINNTN